MMLATVIRCQEAWASTVWRLRPRESVTSVSALMGIRTVPEEDIPMSQSPNDEGDKAFTPPAATLGACVQRDCADAVHSDDRMQPGHVHFVVFFRRHAPKEQVEDRGS